MLSFKRHDALHPDKESVLSLNLLPLLVFGLGFLLTRTLIAALPQPQDAGQGDPQ